MCDFPSWYEDENGTIIFLTDKDVRDHDIPLVDAVGHSAILDVFKRPEVGLKRGEGFPCPPEVAIEIQRKNMTQMIKVSGLEGIKVTSGGELIEDFELGNLLYELMTKEWYGDDYESGCDKKEWAAGDLVVRFVYNDTAKFFLEKSNAKQEKTLGRLMYEAAAKAGEQRVTSVISYKGNETHFENSAKAFLKAAKRG